MRSIAAAAGYRDVRYVKAKVLIDPSPPIHAHQIKSEEDGHVILYATQLNSAMAGGREFRARTLEDQTGVKGVVPRKMPPVRW